MTLSDWCDVVALINEAWPDHPRGPRWAEVWHGAVAALDADAVRGALREYVAAGHAFPPNGGELRALVVDAGWPDWEEAWIELHRALSDVGWYRSPVWGNALLGEVVDAFGWRRLCETPEREMVALRAQLRDVYRGLRSSARRTGDMPRIGAPLAPCATKTVPRGSVPEVGGHVPQIAAQAARVGRTMP